MKLVFLFLYVVFTTFCDNYELVCDTGVYDLIKHVHKNVLYFCSECNRFEVLLYILKGGLGWGIFCVCILCVCVGGGGERGTECVYVRESYCTFMYIYVHVCVCVRARACVCVRACVHACMRVCDTCLKCAFFCSF